MLYFHWQPVQVSTSVPPATPTVSFLWDPGRIQAMCTAVAFGLVVTYWELQERELA